MFLSLFVCPVWALEHFVPKELRQTDVQCDSLTVPCVDQIQLSKSVNLSFVFLHDDDDDDDDAQ